MKAKVNKFYKMRNSEGPNINDNPKELMLLIWYKF